MNGVSTNPATDLQAACYPRRAVAKRSPILGYNHNVKYRGLIFHVQTEDSGLLSPHLFTHLFYGGVIISTRKLVYDAGSAEDAIKGLMQSQHKIVLKDLKGGKFDDKIDVYLALGWCYKRTDRIDLAIESLERGLEIDPSQAILYYNLACYRSLLGDKHRAIEFLGEALRRDPDYRDLVPGESDFDRVRDDPEFQALLSVTV